MNGLVFQLWEYLLYFLKKENEHSIHSPYYFQCYCGLQAYLKTNRGGNRELEDLRKSFAGQKTLIQSRDYGAGSRWTSGSEKMISTIARRVVSPLRNSLIYAYFCQQTEARQVLDLGTSLGINTGYLREQVQGMLYSFEGDPSLLKLAEGYLGKFFNVQLVPGNLDESLQTVVNQLDRIDFVLMDANHRFGPTLGYFRTIYPKLHERSIVVVADIHWSREMKQAWEQLKAWPGVTGSIDFFDCGILFFRPSPNQTHLVLEV